MSGPLPGLLLQGRARRREAVVPGGHPHVGPRAGHPGGAREAARLPAEGLVAPGPSAALLGAIDPDWAGSQTRKTHAYIPYQIPENLPEVIQEISREFDGFYAIW